MERFIIPKAQSKELLPRSNGNNNKRHHKIRISTSVCFVYFLSPSLGACVYQAFGSHICFGERGKDKRQKETHTKRANVSKNGRQCERTRGIGKECSFNTSSYFIFWLRSSKLPSVSSLSQSFALYLSLCMCVCVCVRICMAVLMCVHRLCCCCCRFFSSTFSFFSSPQSSPYVD